MFAIPLLVFLEIALSLDNALALAVLVNPLPLADRQKALWYGMWGAFIFRLLAISFLTFLMHVTLIKIIAASYLLYLFVEHFLTISIDDPETTSASSNFWHTVVAVEVMDVAFSMDSIFAGIGVSRNPWVITLGGIIGIVIMRCVAFQASKIIDKFPWLEDVAYGLIGVLGVKLMFWG